MGGFSWLARRPAAAGDPTHALFAAQTHSIVDNLVALFEHGRAWNCSNQERALAEIQDFSTNERWETFQRRRRQSLGEHSHNVAIYADQIASFYFLLLKKKVNCKNCHLAGNVIVSRYLPMAVQSAPIAST